MTEGMERRLRAIENYNSCQIVLASLAVNLTLDRFPGLPDEFLAARQCYIDASDEVLESIRGAVKVETEDEC